MRSKRSGRLKSHWTVEHCHWRPRFRIRVGVRVRVRVRVRVKVRVRVRVKVRVTDGVGDLDVDLRPVEGAAALVHLVVPPLALERLDQPRRRLLPDLIRADRLVGPGGEVDLVPG